MVQAPRGPELFFLKTGALQDALLFCGGVLGEELAGRRPFRSSQLLWALLPSENSRLAKLLMG